MTFTSLDIWNDVAVTFHTAPAQKIALKCNNKEVPYIFPGEGVTLTADMFESVDKGHITALYENGAVLLTKCDHAGTLRYVYFDIYYHKEACSVCHIEETSNYKIGEHTMNANGICEACGGRTIYADQSALIATMPASMRAITAPLVTAQPAESLASKKIS